MEEIYIVALVTSDNGCYHERVLFTSFDGDKVKAYTERFNKIVTQNKERIIDTYMEGEYPYLCDYIVYENPIVKYFKTKHI